MSEEKDIEHLLFDFVSDLSAMDAGLCVDCRKELAEDGLYCHGCRKLRDDINLDRREEE